MQNSSYSSHARAPFLFKRARVSKKKTLLAIVTIYAFAGAMAFIAFTASRSSAANPGVSNPAR